MGFSRGDPGVQKYWINAQQIDSEDVDDRFPAGLLSEISVGMGTGGKRDRGCAGVGVD